MTVEAWLAMAVADAGRRELPQLAPLLEGLAVSTRRLRRTSFNDDARGEGGEPSSHAAPIGERR